LLDHLPSDIEVLKVYDDLQQQFEVTNEGPIDEYLGVKVQRKEDNSILTISTRLM